MRSDSQRKRKKNSCEGNPDLLFSFSRFCFLIRNNGRNTNAAGISASPIEGAFGGVDGGETCECASRIAAIHGTDAQGGGSIEAGADDNMPYDSRKSFKIAGHKLPLSADPSDSFSASAALGKHLKLSA
jgi:hypothetical protein